MPYVSLAQEGWAHTAEGQRALGGADRVAEWDRATKGKHLPKHVEGSHKASYATGGPVTGVTPRYSKG